MGSAAVGGSSSSDSQDPGCFLAAQLNVLGEEFNPFEFLSTHQKPFMDSYQQLLEEWETMDWNDVSPFVEALICSEEVSRVFSSLKEHCLTVETANKVASFFNEKILENDNKLTDHRINLVTMAMRPHQLVGDEGRDSPPQWTLLALNTEAGQPCWLLELQSLLTTNSYAKDPNIAVWDLCCCVLATRQPIPFTSICTHTHLNPENETGGEVFFQQAITQSSAESMPLVLGLVEWPVQETRETAFEETCARHDLTVTQGCKGSQVALATSCCLGTPLLLTRKDADDNTSFIDTTDVMKSVIMEVESGSQQIPKKERDGLVKTTAFKTMACIVPISESNTKWLVCVVIHAKEPKNSLSVRALSLFVNRMVISAQACGPAVVVSAFPDIDKDCQCDFSNFVVMSDTNVSCPKIASVFRDHLSIHALEVSPADPNVSTTRKRRSKLHGQTYDKRKCHVTVTAPKDCIISAQGTLLHTKGSECVFPNINGDDPSTSDNEPRTLPDSGWVSDHCIVTSIVTLNTAVTPLDNSSEEDTSLLCCSS